MSVSNNDILHNLGGSDKFSLSNLVEPDVLESEEPQLLQQSPYYNIDSLIDLLQMKQNTLKCLSMNIQSLNAKFSQLEIYIHNLSVSNCEFDVICIQETWLNSNSDCSLLQLDGYTLLTQPYSSSAHGGLAMYIKSNLEYRELQISNSPSNIWEGQFVEMNLGNSQLTIGNIYRPPNDINDNYHTFTDEFQNCINNLTGEVLIAGDFNIDLLRINEKPAFCDYFDTIMSSGYIPKITLPTRLSRNNATLIDNFLCKLSHNFSKTTTGILNHKLSDHQPYFICMDYLNLITHSSKYITITKSTNESIEKFNDYLSKENIVSKLNPSSDANQNYETIATTLESGLNKFFPVKTVKFCKHKNKNSKWITNGVLNSIRFRDKLYCKLKRTPRNDPLYDQLKSNLDLYNKVLRKIIRLTKTQHYHNLFKKFNNDIKNTWLSIKEIMNKNKNMKKIAEFITIRGEQVFDKQIIANEFNSLFTKLGHNYLQILQYLGANTSTTT